MENFHVLILLHFSIIYNNEIKIMDTKIPHVGKNSNAPYIAFGDDSAYEEILLYGFFVCRRNKKKLIKKEILKLKKKFGIPNKVPIHLRNLLNGHYRKKHNVSKLDKSKQPLFFEQIVRILNKNSCLVRYCHTIIPDSGKILPENSPDEKIPIIENHKAIINQMVSACFLPYMEKDQILFTADDFEIYLSHDNTKIKAYPNQPRKQAHFFSEGLIPMTHPPKPGSYKRLVANIEPMKSNLFLQFSDAVVYLLSHALSKKCKQTFYKNEMEKIKFRISHSFVTENNQKEFGVEIP